MYEMVRGEDGSFNEDAAKVLLKLSISLGANDKVEGFQARLIEDLDAVQTFDGATLRQMLLEPQSVADAMAGVGMRNGLVTGIKSRILSAVEFGQIWRDCDVSETTNGFAVLNTLVDFNKPG